MTSGELCFLLNGNQSNINWTQNLTGTDADTYPLPFSTHAQVYAYDNTYSNNDLSPIITFADANVKALCVAKWDTNGDGELSEAEAAAVADLGEVFRGNTTITSFNELQYFTSLTTIGNNAFDGCTSLTSIAIPTSLNKVKTEAFKNCTSLSKVIVTDIAAWCGIIYDITSPWEPLGNFPLGLALHLYSDENTEITEVVIPEGVTRIEPMAFRDAKYVTSVTIPNSVTYIGEQAFSGMHRLTSITIPQNVTTLGQFTFKDCQSLTSFTIPEGVVNMEGNAFRDCTSLTSVSLPESLKVLGGHTFIGCRNLTSITIPDGITILSRIAFEGCSSLTTFTYNKAENALTKVNGVYQIGTAEDLCNFAILSTAANSDISAQLTADIDYTGYTFSGYNVGEQFQYIGLNGYCGTFDGNGHTITVDINNPDSWAVAALFRELGKGGVIKNLRVAGHVESVSKFSAGIVSNLKSGKVSHCVSDVDIVSHIDGDCTDGGIAGIATYDGEESIVEYCVVAGSFQGSNAHHRGGIIGIGYAGNSDNITIDNCLFLANVDGLDVTESGTFIRQPTDKTTINNCYYLNVLGTVTSGTQTTTAQMTSGELCFLLNGDQSNIDWTQNLTGTDVDTYPLPFSTHAQVYTNGYTYSNERPNIVIGDTFVAAVPCGEGTVDLTFMITNVNPLEVKVSASSEGIAGALTIPASVTAPNGYIFAVKGIGYEAFIRQSNITSVVLPEGLTYILDRGFADNTSLVSATLPSTLTSMEQGAFINCPVLESINIPSSLTKISYHAFGGDQALKSIILPEGLTCIEAKAFKDSGLESVTFPTSLTEVGDDAFWAAPLRSVDFNGSTVTINGAAFLGTALETITVPSNVTLRGWSHFYGCSSLQTATIESAEYDASIVDMFYGCTSLETAVLPSTKIMNGSFFGGCSSLESVTFLSVDDSFDYTDQNYAKIFRDVPPTQVQFNVPAGTAERLLQGGYMYLSDLSGLPLVRLEFEAEAARIQAMADALTDGNKTALANVISEARTAVNAAEDYATVYAQIAAIKNAAKTYLTTATLPAGFDVTAAFITNPDFDRFQIGWNVCGGGDHRGWQGNPDYSHYENGNVVMDKFLQAWRSSGLLDNGQISQAFTNLPAGTYRLECDAVATCGYDATVEVTGVNLFAGTETTALFTEDKKPQHFTVEFTQTETGDCTIGIDINNTTANWVAMDNVRLYCLEINDIAMNNTIACADIMAHQGQQVKLPIKITNEPDLSIVGISFTLTLPEGVTVKEDDGTPVYSLVSERLNPKRFNVYTNQYADGSWGFRISTNNTTAVLNGTEGEFMTITLDITDGMEEGDYNVCLMENKLSVRNSDNSIASKVISDSVSKLTINNVIKGDVNGDGEVDLSDAIMVTYYSLHVAPANFIEAVADVNGDGEIDLSDAITIIYKSLGVQ